MRFLQTIFIAVLLGSANPAIAAGSAQDTWGETLKATAVAAASCYHQFNCDVGITTKAKDILFVGTTGAGALYFSAEALSDVYQGLMGLLGFTYNVPMPGQNQYARQYPSGNGQVVRVTMHKTPTPWDECFMKGLLKGLTAVALAYHCYDGVTGISAEY